MILDLITHDLYAYTLKTGIVYWEWRSHCELAAMGFPEFCMVILDMFIAHVLPDWPTAVKSPLKNPPFKESTDCCLMQAGSDKSKMVTPTLVEPGALFFWKGDFLFYHDIKARIYGSHDMVTLPSRIKYTRVHHWWCGSGVSQIFAYIDSTLSIWLY